MNSLYIFTCIYIQYNIAIVRNNIITLHLEFILFVSIQAATLNG